MFVTLLSITSSSDMSVESTMLWIFSACTSNQPRGFRCCDYGRVGEKPVEMPEPHAGRGQARRQDAFDASTCHLRMASSEPSSSSASASSDVPSPAPKGNAFFRRWQREFSLLTGYGIEQDDRVNIINRRNCERWKKELFHYSAAQPIVFKHLAYEVIQAHQSPSC